VLTKVDGTDFNALWKDSLAQVIPLQPSIAGSAAYPVGFSTFSMTLAEAEMDGNWPLPAAATVMTVKSATDTVISQWWTRSDTTSPSMYFRTIGTSVSSAWQRLLPKDIGPPVGSIIMYGANANFPTGWLKCSGLEVSRAQYPELFAVIGTAYGTGDGSTTFNLPSFNGGLFPSHNAPGTTGGQSSHQHTVPGHNHSIPAHAHSLSSKAFAMAQLAAGAPAWSVRRIATAAWAMTHTQATTPTAAGGSGQISNGIELGGDTDTEAAGTTGPGNSPPTSSTTVLPPYLGVIFMIKAFESGGTATSLRSEIVYPPDVFPPYVPTVIPPALPDINPLKDDDEGGQGH